MIAAAEPGSLVRLRRRVAPPREVLLLVEVRVHRAFGLRLQPVLKVEPELGRALRPCLLELQKPLLLFGGELKVRHAQQTITVDGWIEFDAAPRVGVLFRQLRAELDRLLLQKLATPDLEFELAGRTIGTIVSLLQEEEGVHQAQDA